MRAELRASRVVGVAVAAALLAAVIALVGVAGSSSQAPSARYEQAVAADDPLPLRPRRGRRSDIRITASAARSRVELGALQAPAAGALEFWARPSHGRSGAVTVRWGAHRLALRTPLPPRRWSHVVVDWASASGAVAYVDGQRREQYLWADRAGVPMAPTITVRGLSGADDVRHARLYGHRLGARAAARHFAAGRSLLGRAARESSGVRVRRAAVLTPDVPPAIGGQASDGETLTAMTGEWPATPPVSYTIAWLRCAADGSACVVITGAEGNTYELGAEDVGHAIRVRVTASAAEGDGTATSDATAVVAAAPPEAVSAPAVDGPVLATSPLSSSTGIWTGTPPLTFARQWRRCDAEGDDCEDIAGATGSTYEPAASDVGSALRVVVTASNAAGSTAATSSPTEVVQEPEAPARVEAPVVVGDPLVGEPLTGSDGSWLGVPAPVIARQWRRCDVSGLGCEDIAGATNATYVPTPDDEGHVLRVGVTATNVAGQQRTSSAPTDTVAMAPMATVAPAISGEARDGQRLTADRGRWVATRPVDLQYQWQRCDSNGQDCIDVLDATNASYDLGADDVGATLRVVVGASNDYGSAAASSEATAEVVASAPENVVAPQPRGIPQPGGTFRAHVGRWTGTPEIAYSYSWKLCDEHGDACSTIAGEDGETLAVDTAMGGHTVRLVVHAENAIGSADATSAATRVIGQFGATISGTPRVGETLAASPDDLPSAAAQITFQWQRCSAGGGSCVDIAGATDDRLVLDQADAGATIRVLVEAEDANGTVSGHSPLSGTIAELVPENTELPVVAGRPALGFSLSATEGEWDHGGVATYQWSRCTPDGVTCTPIAAADAAQYDVVEGDVGARLRVSVTRTSSGGARTADSRPTELVTDTSLANVVAPSLAREAGPSGDVFVADAGDWAGSGILTYAYAWQRCDAAGNDCRTVPGATDDRYALSQSDVGARLRVVVRAHDDVESAAARSAATAPVTARLVAAAAPGVIVGTAAEGELLALDGATWEGVGPLDLSYQWRRCDVAGDSCVNIPGATTPDRVAEDADVGSTLRLAASAAGEDGTASITTAPTAVIAAAAPLSSPTVVSAPTISGTVTVGEPVTASPGTWAGVGPFSYTYQWQTCDLSTGECRDRDGATGGSYVPDAEDLGLGLAVRVVARDTLSAAVAVASTTTSVRESAAPVAETAPLVSGVSRQGETLSVTDGTWSGAGPFTYVTRWQTCDDSGTCADLEDADGSTYTLTDEDVDGRVRAVVQATDEDDRSTFAASAVSDVVEPAAPVSRELPSITGITESGQVLEATPGTWEGMGALTYTYQWQSCDMTGADCEDLVGATTSDYALGQGDEGATLRVVVTAANASGDAVATSDASAPVAAAAGPIVTAAPSISGTARENATLTADPGAWTGTGSVQHDYQWLRCDEAGTDCEPIEGATSASLALSADEVFGTVRVEVTATDDVGARRVQSPPTAVVGSAEDGELFGIVNTARPAVVGESRVGEDLTADPGAWEDGDGLTLGFQWWSCDAAGASCHRIDGAHEPDYQPVPGDLGRRLRVMVSASSGAASVTVMGSATAAVAPPRPQAAAPPAVYGDAVDGSYLWTEGTEWVPADVDVAETWQRCDEDGEDCSDIPGAIGSDYLLTPEDIGHAVRVVLTATGASGAGTAVSEPSSTVQPLAPMPWEDPSISGLARVEGTLTADPGPWDGSPNLSYAYAWQRCDADGEDCLPIVGATSQEHVLAAADLGTRLRVEVTVSNAAGSATATSDATEVVDAAAPPALDREPAILGDPHDGQRLTAEFGGWVSAAPLSHTYAWQRCDGDGDDCADIAGATSSTYELTSADIGSTVRLTVTAHNPTGQSDATTDATDVVSTGVPTSIEDPFVSGIFRPGHQVVAESGMWGGSAPFTYAYQWQRCDADGNDCEDIDGAMGASYTLGADDARQSVTVAVTATNAHGSATSSSYPTVVGGLTPHNTALPTISGVVHTGQTLTASPGDWNNEPDWYDYRWQSCNVQATDCADIPWAVAPTLNVGTNLVARRLRVVVTANNDGENAPPSAVSALTGLVGSPSPLNVTPPTLDQTRPAVDYPYAVTAGTWVGDGITYTYQWQVCEDGDCSAIWNATAATFLPRSWDVGRTLRVVVTGRTSNGAAVSVTTAQSQPVGPSRPRNLSPPAIAGSDLVVGARLDAAAGDWSASAWQFEPSWLRCDADGEDCVGISGADGWSYWPKRSDEGHALRLSMSARGDGGTTTAVSEPSEPIGPASRPVFGTPPAVSGTVEVGAWIDGGNPDLTGSPDIVQDGQWERCDAAGEGCEPIPGATGWGYTVRRGDAGYRLRLRATLTNGWGTVSRRTGVSAVVPPASQMGNVVPPVVESVPWWQQRHVVGSSITATVGDWAGFPDDVEIQWQRCDRWAQACVDLAGATTTLYRPVAADVGSRLRVRATAVAEDTAPVVAYSDETTPIGLDVSFTPILAGTVAVGEPVTVQHDLDVSDGLPTDVDYRWEAECWNYRSNTWASATVAEGSATFTPNAKLAGCTLKAVVTATRRTAPTVVVGAGEREVSAPIRPALTRSTSPSIAGDTTAGRTLTLDPGQWDGGGGPILYDYVWQRCAASGEDCEPIAGATGASYELSAADVGHHIGGLVSAHVDRGDDSGAEAPGGGLRHEATATVVGPVVAGTAPESTDAPTISGGASEHQVVEALPGTWAGSDPMTYAYQWQTCDAYVERCRDIDGATESHYAVTATDYGRRLRVRVVATNAMGQAAATSSMTEPVAAGTPPKVTELPSLTVLGPLGPGSMVMSDGGRWADASRDELAYEWQRCPVAGGPCEPIDGAVGRAYVLTAEDAGHTVQVAVTASTDAGDATALSDPSALIGSDPAPTADGQIVYVDSSRTAIKLAPKDGTGTPTTIVSCDDLDGVASCELRTPRISPGMDLIAFEARSSLESLGDGSLYVVSVGGGALRRVTSGAEPAWSADGTELLYTGVDPVDGDLRALRTSADGLHADEPDPAVPVLDGDDGQGGTALTGPTLKTSAASGLPTRQADVADDGRVAFVGMTPEGSPRLYVAADRFDAHPHALDFGGKFRLVAHPRFLPDGHAIAFNARLDDDSLDGDSIWEVDVDGKGLHRVSPADGKLYGPPVPTEDEVLTTRADFDWCTSPSLAARAFGASTQTWGDDICEVRHPRAYAINHDGGNPHFIGTDEALDVDVAHAHASKVKEKADRLYIEEGLEELNRFANGAAKEAAEKAVGRRVLHGAVKVLAKTTTRATVVGTVLEFLSGDGDLDCEVGPFMRETRSQFVSAGSLLHQIASTGISAHPILVSRATAQWAQIDQLREDAHSLYTSTNRKCKIYYKVARDTAERVATALEHSQTYLHEIDLQHQRRVAYREAVEIDRRGRPVGRKTCADAPALVDALGRGEGRRNHVVYWAAPPPPEADVTYIGRSRDLEQRCEDHPPERRAVMRTLNLPPMALMEARRVEEALIAHFGPDEAAPNQGVDRADGQLVNKRHEISPLRLSYCEHLLVGQFLLVRHDYGAYAAAYYTRDKVCPGVGGER